MKTNWMDAMEHYLSTHKGQGPVKYLIYSGIFLSMLMYVLMKPVLHMLTHKLRQK
jgi:hypothetical protein